MMRARCAGLGIDSDGGDAVLGVAFGARKLRAWLAGADHLAQAPRLTHTLA